MGDFVSRGGVSHPLLTHKSKQGESTLALAMQNHKKTPPNNWPRIRKASLFNSLDLSTGFYFLLFTLNFLVKNRMRQMKKLSRKIIDMSKDENFMHLIENIEVLVSKVLSIFMVLVILVALGDLAVFLMKELFTTPYGKFNTTLFKIFGLFLNILIALEILENITAYLKKHVVQVELVIVTSLIAVARKIIILDLEKVSGIDIIGLGVAIFALSISYLVIRFSNSRDTH